MTDTAPAALGQLSVTPVVPGPDGERIEVADPVEREKAVRQLLADEERFAQQRAEAMAIRGLSAGRGASAG